MTQALPARSVEQIVTDLVEATNPAKQNALKEELTRHPGQFDQALFQAIRRNPFVQLSPQELNDIEMRRRLREAEQDLLLLRQLAARLRGHRIAVFAMPKSGSTFIAQAIAHAANLGSLSLTSIAPDGGGTSSRLGMNGREQEIDELAVVLQTVRTRGRWIAQHHTRFTPYLGHQLTFYGIRPIVTVRTIDDALVSMDDMIMEWRSGNRDDWSFDPPYVLPRDFTLLDQAERLSLLAQDYGVWLIKFLLSWKRAIAAGQADPLILSYEEDVLNPASLCDKVARFLGLGPDEQERLAAFASTQATSATRFNQGVAGRGSAVPDAARTMLRDYAERFRTELGEKGTRYLFGG